MRVLRILTKQRTARFRLFIICKQFWLSEPFVNGQVTNATHGCYYKIESGSRTSETIWGIL